MNTAGSKWVRGGQVLRRQGGQWKLERADLRLEGGRIAEIAAPLQREPVPGEIDARKRIVAPGLINAHLHSNDNFLRGRVDNLPLELYMLVAVPVTGVKPISMQAIRARTLLGGMECLLSGTTTLLDDCYHLDGINAETIDAVMEAYEDLGMRAWVTANLSDRPMPDTVPYAAEMLGSERYLQVAGEHHFNVDRALEICEGALQRYNKDHAEGRVKFAMAASGPQRCSDGLLERVWALASRWEVPVVCHVLETRAQAITGRLFYGQTLVQRLESLGCLSPLSCLVHGIWVTPEDIARMGRRQVSVLHNPTSNLRLGSGVAPIRELLEAGVNVALGTDGISTNDAQNLHLEMRLAGCLHKPVGPDYRRWVGAQEAYEMATLGGARALGQQGALGEIEVGFRADLILYDEETPAFTPLSDPLRQIVFSEVGQSIRTVIIDGQVVVDHGKLTRLDQGAILSEAQEQAEKFFRDNAEAFREVERFLPAFENAYWKTMAQACSPSRYIYGWEAKGEAK